MQIHLLHNPGNFVSPVGPFAIDGLDTENMPACTWKLVHLPVLCIELIHFHKLEEYQEYGTLQKYWCFKYSISSQKQLENWIKTAKLDWIL